MRDCRNYLPKLANQLNQDHLEAKQYQQFGSDALNISQWNRSFTAPASGKIWLVTLHVDDLEHTMPLEIFTTAQSEHGSYSRCESYWNPSAQQYEIWVIGQLALDPYTFDLYIKYNGKATITVQELT